MPIEIEHQFTLDETWELCLRMWKWIAEHYDPRDKNNDGSDCVDRLKDVWLEENGYGDTNLKHECFFCQYASEEEEILIRIDGKEGRRCPTCPARAMCSTFHCENYTSYCWHDKPKKFYKKLVMLYKRYEENKK